MLSKMTGSYTQFTNTKRNLIGSFHISSHASGLWDSGSERGAGTLLIASIKVEPV